MDLQTQLECAAEKDWNKEKMELLERFDSERKEWEGQWKVMQKKIEELYQEVKLRRESNMNVFENKPTQNKAEEQFCSPILEWSNTPGINCCSLDKESLPNKAEKESKDMRNKRRNHAFVKDLLTSENSKKPDDFIGLKTTKNYTQDLNMALKELAKVSEDLCTYQEEIRKKANHRRCLKEMPSTAFSDVEKTRCLPWQKREAPPVPPRSTSRHISNSLAEVSEAFAKDMEHKNICKIQEHPDGNPFIYPAVPLAMTDEWKSVSEPTVAAMGLTEKQDQLLAQKFPVDVYRNTWSCDASKVGNGPKNGSSPCAVQKCFSDENKHPKFQSNVHCTTNLYTPTCDTLDDSGYETGKTQRNETLEAKINEFNRIVFHTDKGKKCLLQNQTPLVLPRDPRPHCVLQDSLTSRTQIEEPSCVSNSRLSSTKEEKSYQPSKDSKTKGQQKQLNGLLSGYQHMFHEHDWRPGNLSGRPRSADSRSNYGVVEKLLKNYEKSASLWNSRFHKEPQVQFESEFAEGNCKRKGHYPLIQVDQGKQEQQKNAVRHVGLYTKLGKEKLKFPEVSVTAKQSNGKGFSRPARPANRRLPSRWASRSPSAPPVMRRTLLNEIS